MKRTLSILLIFAMIFSFAACSGKNNGETTAPPPVVEESAHSREFKDASGKTVFTVDVMLPQITENCDEKVMEYINAEALKIFEDACEFAESNIENASNFMASQNSSSPWTKKVTFETTLLNSRYACFIVKDAFSYFGGETEPVRTTKCFDIQKGAPCTLTDFTTYPDDPELGFETFLSDVLAPALPTRFHNPEYITDEVLGRLDEILNYSDFYLTENGIGFYFDKSRVHEYLSGTYKITFTWDEINFVYDLPAEQ